MGLVLILAGSALDYLIYRDQFYWFLTLRILCNLILVIGLILYYTPLGKEFVSQITFFWLLTAQAMMCYMIFVTEGSNSTYYAGLNLAIISISVIYPGTITEAVTFCVLTILLYLAACFYHEGSVFVFSNFYNNMYFIVLSGVSSSIAGFVNSRLRYSEFHSSRSWYEAERQNQELAKIDKMRSEFLAIISHELRTPLTLILGSLQKISSKTWNAPDSVKELIRLARGSGNRLMRLMNDLLELIRFDEGQLEMKKVPIDLTSFIACIVDSLEHFDPDNKLPKKKEIDDRPLYVIGDPKAMEHIFVNLLGNALKFTEGSESIAIRFDRTDDKATIHISDRGIGIEEELIPIIFDRFRQADASNTRKYEGVGLGLAIVKTLVEKQDGQIAVASKQNEGTTFSVTFPLEKTVGDEESVIGTIADEENSSLTTALREMSETSQNRDKLLEGNVAEKSDLTDGLSEEKRTVLIVEDNREVIKYLEILLEEQFHTSVATDGPSGLEAARNHHPDVILLDLMLPGMDGLEVCRKIKQDSTMEDCKVLLLTARVDIESRLTALRNGADDFLTKPFGGAELTNRIGNLAKASQLQRGLRRKNEILQKTLSELKTTESNLIQSEKLNALGILAAGFLHEINNPMNYSKVALSVAKQEDIVQKNPELMEIMEDIEHGFEQISGIVGDLRVFAFPSDREKARIFPIGKVIRQAERFLMGEIEDIRLENGCGEKTVFAAPKHLLQLFINLFSNSAKALKNNPPEREAVIRIHCEERNNRRLIKVRDNGPGILPENLSRVFDPFFTMNEVGEGSGLGLSVCHTIVKQYNGRLTVDSHYGEWTEFSFDLPTISSDVKTQEQWKSAQ